MDDWENMMDADVSEIQIKKVNDFEEETIVAPVEVKPEKI
jgi:hypothetical protein